MKNKNELSYKDLKMTFNKNIFNFKSTEELEPITTGIGQERGIKALEFGLQVDAKKYLSEGLSIPFEYIPEKIKGDVVKC